MSNSEPMPASINPIRGLDDLRASLVIAMQIEHATIPPYLTALYSIHPGSNSEAVEVIRSVAVEEMLHLCLVANVLNAIGGSLRQTLTAPDFIPRYPAYLPTGETEFQVGLRPFSPTTIDTFLQIERLQVEEVDVPLVLPRTRRCLTALPKSGEGQLSFYSIGLFYSEIIRCLYALCQELGEERVFCGDPARQIMPEQYYSGAGSLIVVNDFRSANRALRLIQEQGEGAQGHRIYAGEASGIHALAHYYRFQQLRLGRYYRTLQLGQEEPDQPDSPSGPALDQQALDWQAVYPIQEDLCLEDLPEGSAVRHQAIAFQQQYACFLEELERVFDGEPQQLGQAVVGMFRLRDLAEQLVRTPIPGREHRHAAPLFRLE